MDNSQVSFMMFRLLLLWRYLFVAMFSLLLPSLSFGTGQMVPPVYTVGIVSDGTTPDDLECIHLFQREIEAMAEGEFLVKFPGSVVRSGKDTAAGARRALARLYANPEVDLILALGPIASTEAYRNTDRPKPVVAPWLLESVVGNVPRQEGDTGLHNLVYIDSMFYINRAVMSMQKLVSFKSVVVMLDQRLIREIPELEEMAGQIAKKYTMDVQLIPVNSSVEDALTAIPEGTGAVMVGPLYHLTEEQLRLLAGGLIERKFPAFSLNDYSLVELGLLAGNVPADMEEKLARRTSVAVQDILLGEKAESLEISFSRSSGLTINMATARALDIYPSLAVMTGANLLNEKRTDIKRHLTLEQAVKKALQANLDLLSARRRVQAGIHAVSEARSTLLPQVGIATGARAIDEDRARLGFGANPQKAWTGSVSGSQQIYSEKKWAAYTVEQHNQTGREMERETVRLDVMHEASVAYFNVLRAKTIERLFKDNLKLTLANLERSRIRMSTGVAGPDEVYRWETKLATDKMDVLEKESRTLDTMEALNRILNRPLQELFIAEETDLSDPLLIASDKLFFQCMNNPKYLHQFRKFAVSEALVLRPELKAYDAAIKARERLKKAAGREFWLPEFSVEGQVEQFFSEGGSGQRSDFDDGLDDTDWQVGVFARLPLFEGGRKSATLGKTGEELAGLKIDRQDAAERIGQDVLNALNGTRASYPGISLSREAADAARRNLRLVTDSYIEGIKSIIDLLDAQNQALSAEQGAANAVYNFLIDLMGVQRAMGEFIFFLPESERQAWMQRLEEYLH
jgi:outer membrane protein TolC/ABC-type uncharacterized transport system substrate-binding protein